MEQTGGISCAGYLHENYHYFHLRDTAGQERDFHFHEFDKIVLFLAGHVDYIVENETYRLEPWTVLPVQHHAIHKAIIDKAEPYERVILYLDRRYFERVLPEGRLMECFRRTERPGGLLLVPDETQKQALQGLIQAYEHTDTTEFGAQAMRDTLVMQMLIVIGRMRAAAEPQAMQCDPKIQRTLSYINEHLSEELSVELLADQAYLSKYHFMRLFKAQIGSTVHAYVRQKRLLCAARLIREGMTVSDAAAKSGFSDYSAFHRAFKESFGVSPGKIKQAL